jgi:hypothetical protein
MMDDDDELTTSAFYPSTSSPDGDSSHRVLDVNRIWQAHQREEQEAAAATAAQQRVGHDNSQNNNIKKDKLHTNHDRRNQRNANKNRAETDADRDADPSLPSSSPSDLYRFEQKQYISSVDLFDTDILPVPGSYTCFVVSCSLFLFCLLFSSADSSSSVFLSSCLPFALSFFLSLSPSPPFSSEGQPCNTEPLYKDYPCVVCQLWLNVTEYQILRDKIVRSLSSPLFCL